MGPGHRRRTAGFTLIEVLVSLLVGSLVLLSVAGVAGLVAGRPARGAAGDPAEQALRAETVRAALQRALEGAYVVAEPPTRFRGESRRTASGLPMDEVVFQTLDQGPVTGGGGGPFLLRLRPTAGGLALDRWESGGAGEPRTLLLLPEVRGLDVRYLDDGTPARWVERWPEQARLPRALEIRFHPADGRRLPAALRPALRVALPAWATGRDLAAEHGVAIASPAADTAGRGRRPALQRRRVER